jgi:hypothetical protein
VLLIFNKRGISILFFVYSIVVVDFWGIEVFESVFIWRGIVVFIRLFKIFLIANLTTLSIIKGE